MIDAHHHIWLQKDLPWLLGPEQPRIFGPYAAIKRDGGTHNMLSKMQTRDELQNLIDYESYEKLGAALAAD